MMLVIIIVTSFRISMTFDDDVQHFQIDTLKAKTQCEYGFNTNMTRSVFTLFIYFVVTVVFSLFRDNDLPSPS